MSSGPTRRELLRHAAFATGAAATALWLGRARADEPRALISRSSRPHDLETPSAFFDEENTPNDVFFVRSHFGPAILDERSYRLEVGGFVDRPLSLSLDELRRFPRVTVPAVLQCSGNGRAFFRPRVPGAPWERGAVGQARWTGVRLADVLKAAGLKPVGRYVRMLGADTPPMPTVPAFARSLPVDKALHPATLLAFEMNGAPLPLLHGAPLRVVVPGWVGDDWMKWLRSLSVEADEDPGFYMKTAYRIPNPPVAPGAAAVPGHTEAMKSLVVKSLIARPGAGQVLAAAKTAITGVAFAGERAVARVEVSVDGGRSYQRAELEAPRGLGAWQHFRFAWTPRPGRYALRARATDAEGRAQPETPVWNPSGYLWNGIDEVTVEVRA